MASYLYVYTLNTAEQPDLFYSDEGKLNISFLEESMENFRTPINEDGYPEGEGFGKIQRTTVLEQLAINSFCITQGTLGNYNEAKFTDDTFTTEKKQHKYYTKSKIFLTENSDFIIIFDNSIEERAKAKVKAQIESLGFDTTSFRITDKLIRSIQSSYQWSAATFNKIVKHGDSTRRVSFQIDPGNDTDPSLVQEQYSEHGEMSHIKFEMPYEQENAPNLISVTLYSDKNRIIINEEEFPNNDTFNDFVLYLIHELNRLQRE
jgi:hypothetical protein